MLEGTRPVVTDMSSTGSPPCSSVARAVAAVLPRFSQVTWIRAGSSRATRRKLAVVATGCGWGESSSTARSTVAISAPPFTAGGAFPPGATSANRASGRASYSPSDRRVTAVASSKVVMPPAGGSGG